MIKEAYVSLEVAKLLKEKGFDEECHQKYDDEGYLSFNPGYINEEKPNEDFSALAPTHQMAMKWLREVHNIFIQIKRDNQYYEGTPVMPITEHDKKRGHSSEYYAVVLDAKSNSKSFEHFDRYEEAIEAALKYSLKNLI